MSKQTYLVIQSSGSRHIVRDAASFMVEGGEAFFYENGVRIAYFSGVSVVVVQAAQPESSPAPLSVLGSVADFAIRPTVEIGTMNITCPAGKPEFAAEIIKAIASVHLVPGVV